MASAIIDRAALAVLVQTALAAIGGALPHVPMRRTAPETTAWCRLKSVKLARHPRTRQSTGGGAGPDEIESGSVVVTVEVGVGAGLANAYALESATQKVVLKLHEQVLAESAPDNGHRLELFASGEDAEEGDVVLDRDTQIEVSEIKFRGLARRLSGTSAVDLLN